jgi:hypothetical protein
MFLHKLENLYGGLIRLLTALLTLTLLVVAGGALINWQRATAVEPKTEATQQTPPKVATDDLVKRVVASQTGSAADPISANDPNRAAYERMSKTIAAFATKHNVAKEDADVDSLISSIHDKVAYQDTATLKAAFATGLADALEHTLANAKIEALLTKPATKKDDEWSEEVTPIAIVNDVIEQYDTEFTQQAEDSDSKGDSYKTFKEKQEGAWRSLARVGGPLLLLILVLQLLTFGRIEQNTRQLSGMGDKAK